MRTLPKDIIGGRGYDDIANEGSRMWADGGATDSQTTGWNVGGPKSSQGGIEDCTHIVASIDGKVLMNFPCIGRQYYICRISIDDL